MVLRKPWPGKTGSMAVLVFAVKSVFGWNVLLLMSSFFQEVRLAREDRFTAINFGQIRGSVVQVRARVRRLRGCKLDFQSSVDAETLQCRVHVLLTVKSLFMFSSNERNTHGLSALTRSSQ